MDFQKNREINFMIWTKNVSINYIMKWNIYFYISFYLLTKIMIYW
jgi:hypothetical protein